MRPAARSTRETAYRCLPHCGNRAETDTVFAGSDETVGGSVDLDGAVEFYAAYLDALYRYEIAVRTEPDDVLAQRRARAHTFLDPWRGTWIDTWNSRPPGLTPEGTGQWGAKLSTARRPTLFLVAEYAVPGWGSLFAGYTGDTGRRTHQSYMYRFLAGEVDGKPAIVTQYSIEPSYGEEGQVTWDFTQGVEVADLGRPVSARGLREPILDDQIQDYRRILEETGSRSGPPSSGRASGAAVSSVNPETGRTHPEVNAELSADSSRHVQCTGHQIGSGWTRPCS